MMKIKPIIAVDLDDTLSCFLNKVCKVYNEKSGDNLTIEKITDWNLTSYVLPEWQDKIFSHEIIYADKFFLDIEPKPDAIETFPKLYNEFDTYIVSSSYFKTVPQKAEWITTIFPFFDIRKFIPCYYKQLIKCHAMIDDGFHNLVNGDYLKLLIDLPHNQNFDAERSGMKRVKTLTEAYEMVKQEFN